MVAVMNNNGRDSEMKNRDDDNDNTVSKNLVHDKNAHMNIATISKGQKPNQHRDTESNSNSERKDHLPYKVDPYLSVLNVYLSEARQNAFGITTIDFWVVGKNELICCQGDYWRDPVFPQKIAFDRIKNHHNTEYAP